MTKRILPWLVAGVAATAVVISLATEAWLNWRPCYLCITQRTLFAGTALAAMAWGRGSQFGRALSGLLSLAGLAVASTQLKVQHAASTTVCGGGVPNALESALEWLAEHVGSFFAVTGFCTDPYPVMGVPMAGWAVLLFLSFIALTTYPQKS